MRDALQAAVFGRACTRNRAMLLLRSRDETDGSTITYHEHECINKPRRAGGHAVGVGRGHVGYKEAVRTCTTRQSKNDEKKREAPQASERDS